LNRQWEIVQKLFILKLELDTEPEKLSEHVTWLFGGVFMFKVAQTGNLYLNVEKCH